MENEPEKIFITGKNITHPLTVNKLTTEKWLHKFIDYLETKGKETKANFELVEGNANNYSGRINLIYSIDLFYFERIRELIYLNKLDKKILDNLFVWPVSNKRVKVDLTLKLQKHKQ